MCLFCLFFYLLRILWFCLQTHCVPCSAALCSTLFASSWVSDFFARRSLPRHSHGKLYSEAKASITITVPATVTTSAGGGAFETAACPYRVALRERCPPRAAGCSPSRTEQLMWASMVHAREGWSPRKPFLSLTARPSQGTGRRALQPPAPVPHGLSRRAAMPVSGKASVLHFPFCSVP